jgi:hypothetical protein
MHIAEVFPVRDYLDSGLAIYRPFVLIKGGIAGHHRVSPGGWVAARARRLDPGCAQRCQSGYLSGR